MPAMGGGAARHGVGALRGVEHGMYAVREQEEGVARHVKTPSAENFTLRIDADCGVQNLTSARDQRRDDAAQLYAGVPG